jgi:ankyrin repeat protein
VANVTDLHAAVKRGDLPAMRRLLEADPALANARSESDARGTFPLHAAAESGHEGAARLLLEYGADVSALDLENDSIALCWAAFFGRPQVVEVLLAAGSAPSQRNKHGLTPLGCALGGAQGQWRKFSNATLEDWAKAAELIRSKGGVE